MACMACGECCRKFRLNVRIGQAMRELKAQGRKFAVSKYVPEPKFEEFLKAMGVKTGDIMVRIPLDMVDEHADVAGLVFYRDCPHLTLENKCDIHETKPEFCKEWMCGAARTGASEMLTPDAVMSGVANDNTPVLGGTTSENT